MEIHPFPNGKILINYPGLDGSIDGYENKYRKLAEYIVLKQLAAVIRLPNPYIGPIEYDTNIRNGITHALENSQTICDSEKPTIYLMGTSAGAGAIATLAWEYPEVKKILLMEPAPISTDRILVSTLNKYKGEIYIVVGDSYGALGEKVGRVFYNAAKSASKRELKTIENCNHQFSGVTNGRILSQAPFWAFLDDKPPDFPNPTGGIELYK